MSINYKECVVTIDGGVAVGKSTTAQELSKLIEVPYLDTGEMYRVATFQLLLKGVDIEDEQAIHDYVTGMKYEPFIKGHRINRLVDGLEFGDEIRQIGVSKVLGKVSKVKGVRKKLIGLQRSLLDQHGSLITDGRDMGSIVFPNAKNKFFMTCSSMIERVRRRHAELLSKGLIATIDEVKSDIEQRDHEDYYGVNAKFSIPNNSINIDTNGMTIAEQTEMMRSLLI